MKKQWSNIGRNAAKKGLPLSAVSTGKSAIDELIATGYALGLKTKKASTSEPLTK